MTVSFEPEDDIDVEAIAVQRALGGSVNGLALLRAHVNENNGEHRPQQEEMVKAVEDSIANRIPLVVQAGTGTGKSLAYVFPLAASGKRGIIATKTNQLTEQLIRNDLPKAQASIQESGGELSFALLKGRNNYACLAKINEIENLEAQAQQQAGNQLGDAEDRLFDLDEPETSTLSKRNQAAADGKQVGELILWAKTSPSGDRSDAPSVTDRVWNQVSTSSADCPGASQCPFGDRCFTELARKQAREANIVVTNHALLAQDVRLSMNPDLQDPGSMGGNGGIFGKHDIVIVDEAHDLPDSLTGALSTELDPRALGKFLSKAAKYVNDGSVNADGDSLTIAKARNDLEAFEDALESIPAGAIETLPEPVLNLLNALVSRFMLIESLLKDAATAAMGEDKPKRASAIGVLVGNATAASANLVSAKTMGEGRVRWVDHRREDDPPVLRTAPLEIGEAFANALEERTLIATSATLTVGGNFGPIRQALGLDGPLTHTLDVGSPFDYPKQGMLYIPRAPFPEPVGAARTAHNDAVDKETVKLVTAAGGRTLYLSTTITGARRVADKLREELPHLAVYAHGDAPADQLVASFASEETSVLCATMGMWQGVNVEGPSCSLVIIDKVAFAPVDDVLTAARRKLADSRGRDGFTEVIVGQAATSLAQGAGRLIRNRSDKGVVAILDPRILTKGYGRTLLKSLPDFRVFTDINVVTAALERLTGGTTEQHRAAAAAVTSFSVGRSTGSNSGQRGLPRRASETKSFAKTTKPRPQKIQ